MNKFKILLLILILKCIHVSAQEAYKSLSNELISIIDSSLEYYGLDDQIINGFVYPVPDSRIKGNPYKIDQWREACLFINKTKYVNRYIKYDITRDDIILKAKVDNGVERLIEMNKFQVDSFFVDNSLFINSRHLLDNPTNLFLEQVFQGKISLYKHYSKVFIREYSELAPYGRYSDLRTNIFLFDGDQLIKVNKKTSFLRFFEIEQQKEIKSFIRKNKIKLKNASNKEIISLMEFCIKISSI